MTTNSMTPSPMRCAMLAQVAALAVLAAPACSSSSGDLASADIASPSAATGCALATRKCTRCHETERLSVYRAPTPRHWQSLVYRMRRQRGSHITAREGRLITECLVYRDFGQDGINALYGEERDKPSP